jgi:hypothetical protein
MRQSDYSGQCTFLQEVDKAQWNHVCVKLVVNQLALPDVQGTTPPCNGGAGRRSCSDDAHGSTCVRMRSLEKGCGGCG